jgi:hypothetical protein
MPNERKAKASTHSGRSLAFAFLLIGLPNGILVWFLAAGVIEFIIDTGNIVFVLATIVALSITVAVTTFASAGIRPYMNDGTMLGDGEERCLGDDGSDCD